MPSQISSVDKDIQYFWYSRSSPSIEHSGSSSASDSAEFVNDLKEIDSNQALNKQDIDSAVSDWNCFTIFSLMLPIVMLR